MNFTKEPLENSVGGQWTRFAVSMTSAPKIIRQPKLLQKKLSLIIARRKTESAKSCNNRIVGVRGFLKYANSRGFVNIPLPSTIPRVNVTSFEPHPFTPEELARFFNEADNLEPPINCRDMRAALMKVEVPVFSDFCTVQDAYNRSPSAQSRRRGLAIRCYKYKIHKEHR